MIPLLLRLSQLHHPPEAESSNFVDTPTCQVCAKQSFWNILDYAIQSHSFSPWNAFLQLWKPEMAGKDLTFSFHLLPGFPNLSLTASSPSSTRPPAWPVDPSDLTPPLPFSKTVSASSFIYRMISTLPGWVHSYFPCFPLLSPLPFLSLPSSLPFSLLSGLSAFFLTYLFKVPSLNLDLIITHYVVSYQNGFTFPGILYFNLTLNDTTQHLGFNIGGIYSKKSFLTMPQRLGWGVRQPCFVLSKYPVYI